MTSSHLKLAKISGNNCHLQECMYTTVIYKVACTVYDYLYQDFFFLKDNVALKDKNLLNKCFDLPNH